MRLEDLLDASAHRTPDAQALVDSSGRCCSFRALAAQAREVAAALKALGVQPGDRVGLCVPKGISAVVSLFGTLYARAAYVPIDVAGSTHRNATILSDSGVRVVLVPTEQRDAMAQDLESAGVQVRAGPAICEFASMVAMSQVPAFEESLAYILYTSGSTGRPKGVAHSHSSALAFVDWCSTEFCPSAQDRFTSIAPLHFDLSTLDVFVAVKHGCALRLVAEDEARMPASIARLIATERISFCYATPTTFRAMMEHADLVATDQSTLRVVCFAGEVFPPKHLAALMRAWPEPAYYNLYGPTETNVCLFYRVPPDWNPAANDALPIGLPCSGDHAMLQGPNGIHGDGFVEGELLISGPSVMLGYWKRGGVDSAAFVQAKGCSWYPTGDFVKRRPDGCFVFQGRRDRLIKRRGFRIELGEIEAAVVRHDAISAAAAVAVSDHRGDTRIVVYFCSKGTVEPSWARLKRHCSRLLPLHMSPDLFRPLPAIPLTSTGKTDYPQLQEMALGLFDH